MKNVLAVLVLLFSFGVAHAAGEQVTIGDGFAVISAEAQGYPGATALGQAVESNIEDFFRYHKDDAKVVVAQKDVVNAVGEEGRGVKFFYFPVLCLIAMVELCIFVKTGSLSSITIVAVSLYAATFSLIVFTAFMVMVPVFVVAIAASIAAFIAAGRAFETVYIDDKFEKILIAIVIVLVAASAGFVSYYPLF